MSNCKVLIVEDELLVAADIEESLELLGYEVIGSVATGKAAIESVDKKLPDIILMDIMLKGDMTGIEAATIIRKKHDVPVIYLTANADIGTIEKAKISLPYGYIIKPFTEKDLQTNIEIARFKFNNDIKTKIESDQFNRFFDAVNQDEKQTLFIDSEKGIEKLDLNKVYYIETADEGTRIYMADEEFNSSKKIDEWESLLPGDKFVRVNKSQIVNTVKIFLAKLPEIIISDLMTVMMVDEDRRAQIEPRLK